MPSVALERVWPSAESRASLECEDSAEAVVLVEAGLVLELRSWGSVKGLLEGLEPRLPAGLGQRRSGAEEAEVEEEEDVGGCRGAAPRLDSPAGSGTMPWTVRWWKRIPERLEKPLPQRLQTKGRSPVWMRVWILSAPDCVKRLPHCGQQ